MISRQRLLNTIVRRIFDDPELAQFSGEAIAIISERAITHTLAALAELDPAATG